jgi:virginiamycin A acetyltransferase
MLPTIKGTKASELQTSVLNHLLLALCTFSGFRKFAIQLAFRLEHGPFYSATAREIMKRHFGIEIGAYSYGGCFELGAFVPPVKIGRYVSIARDVLVYRRDHPSDRLSTHPFFYNSHLGYVATNNMPAKSLEIGHDAWIGSQVVVTPSCQRIGHGSIVGAGAVLTRDVPDFAIVGGVPAKLIRMRFPDAVCNQIRESQWWLLPVESCVRHLDEMTVPLDISLLSHPLFTASKISRSED